MVENKKQKIVKTLDFDGRKLSFEVGELAPRANSAILASMGETVVLATVTVSKEDTDRDYFPLSVEYIEKFYAGGIISGSRFVKRERFPSEEAVLNARMIDRSFRPLFPDNFRKEVQVVVTVLSYDEKNDPAILGINAASAALCISGVPFDGPVAGVRVGLIDGEFVLNPGADELDTSDLNLVISGYDDRIIMIDSDSREVPDSKIEEALDFGSKYFETSMKFQKELIDELGPGVMEVAVPEINTELKNMINEKYEQKINSIIYDLRGNIPGEERSVEFAKIVDEIMQDEEAGYSKAEVSELLEKIVKTRVRKGILEEQKRPSGRKLDEVREITGKVGLLPRTHGSALFSRGITQSLSIVTIGSTRLEQIVESFEGEETKRYMHHYNGQSFSLGEAGRYNYYPGRREVGHGALAEKALRSVIPSEEEFPYTIRVVSEILSQQGSSSMAATCGSTMALMDAGVPIKNPIAGIAIGLVTSEDLSRYVLVTDMQDFEDFYGDMDFKVTGSREGVTAIQMDNKLKGVPINILKEALAKAKAAREFVLEAMLGIINSPRKELSQYAPKITTIKISVDKIGDLIGPGGKVIKEITEKTGAEIDIRPDGQVHVATVSTEAKEEAMNMISAIVEEAEVGKIYKGKVARIESYGVFVDVSPAISGLVHVSEMADKFVSDPNSIVKIGQTVKVKVIGIDDQDRVNFSMKRVQDERSEVEGERSEEEKIK
ncbi:MAG: polyribonucleotide nucleotidyltransferase [Candidatus Dojkabacteria bacterium]|nr:polyribonucleotide nucleotidyltransferase [Candidatus Dojkabacteria bacterium]